MARPNEFTAEHCVATCQSCRHSVHEGGSCRDGTVLGTSSNFPHDRG